MIDAMKTFSMSQMYQRMSKKKKANLAMEECPDGDWIIFYDGRSVCEMNVSDNKVTLYRSDVDIEGHNRPVLEEYEVA